MRQAKHGLSATTARTCRAGDAAALRTRLMACVWISGLGEIGASLLWRLYDYQFFNVPLFMPPGHALLYLLGMALAQWLPPIVSGLVPWIAAPFVVLLVVCGIDTLSLWLFALFVLFMRFGRDKPLYATMFVLALAAGVFYCVLDWLVGLRARAAQWRTRPPL